MEARIRDLLKTCLLVVVFLKCMQISIAMGHHVEEGSNGRHRIRQFRITVTERKIRKNLTQKQTRKHFLMTV